MSFASMRFVLFTAAALLAYFIAPKRFRWGVLLLASLLFYALSDLRALAFVLLTTLTVFAAGRLLDGNRQREQAALADTNATGAPDKQQIRRGFNKRRRLILAAALVANLGVLAAVKYLAVLLSGLNDLLAAAGLAPFFPQLNILLPLGISFYTFQALGYLVDVYRGKHPADRSLPRFALFVSFFPQVVQGPIGRYSQLATQLYAPHSFNYIRVKQGVQLAAWGLFKKAVLADRAAILVNQVIPHSGDYLGIEVTFAMLAYLLQIYADFSGGIDIARGVAQCFGVELAENFARPHFAVSVADYWRRWHITLGAWMRDYLFYPLTLSKPFARLGRFTRGHFGRFGRQIPAVLATLSIFLAVGLWHGPQWKYLAFGLYFGVLVVGGQLLEKPLQSFYSRFPKLGPKQPLWRIFISLRTFVLVAVGKYLSPALGVGHALSMLRASLTSFNLAALPYFIKVKTGYGYRNVLILLLGVALMFAVGLLQERGIRVRDLLARQNIVVRWAVYLIMLFVILLFGTGGSGGNFLYAQY